MSTITVSVEWEQSTAFAGEEIRCIITFRNNSVSVKSRSTSPNTLNHLSTNGREKWKQSLQRQSSMAIPPTATRPSDHKYIRSRPQSYGSTISINAPVGLVKEGMTGQETTGSDSPKSRSAHARSVSIISIGAQVTTNGEQNVSSSKQIRSIQKSHGRSASFQGMPRRDGSFIDSGTASTAPSSPSLSHGSKLPAPPFPLKRMSMHKNRISGKEPGPHQRTWDHKRSGSDQTRWGFASPVADRPSLKAKRMITDANVENIEHTQDGTPRPLTMNKSLQRVLSPASVDGTPRSSIDIYMRSNSSSETLASEYVSTSQSQQPPPLWSGIHRQFPRPLPMISPNPVSDTIMMGYVQLLGSFTVDGSLINMGPFEEVKRKGVIGGQGSGGVVGVEHTKRESGLLSSLGWGSIGQSIGGLLGSQELSSLREMKGIADSKVVPILSTPQSILFVDLKLKPGESKSFSYRHLLPQGLPPSHKGRAFKSSYQLLIGTQRATPTNRQHMVKQVDIPFRVLPGVDVTGELMGYDLMNPHILLKDIASTKYLNDEQTRAGTEQDTKTERSFHNMDHNFSTYIASLLSQSRQYSNLGLLSPTDNTLFETTDPTMLSTEDRIETAIRSQQTTLPSKRNVNRFQIHRNGTKVANITLNRSAYRLGEMVSSLIDFKDSKIRCRAVNVCLETVETVDPTIALRSESSIYRATRKIHASVAENTLNSQKICIETLIPSNATPEFITSGIQLEWRLKFEFVTQMDADVSFTGSLLESITEDERGHVAAAVQQLRCQGFNAFVPLKVYGCHEYEGSSKALVFPI